MASLDKDDANWIFPLVLAVGGALTLAVQAVGGYALAMIVIWVLIAAQEKAKQSERK